MGKAEETDQFEEEVDEKEVLLGRRLVDHPDVAEQVVFFGEELKENDANRPNVDFVRLGVVVEYALKRHEALSTYFILANNLLRLHDFGDHLFLAVVQLRVVQNLGVDLRQAVVDQDPLFSGWVV